MSGRAVADHWDEVWAEYDARQLRLAAARAVQQPASRRPRPVPASSPDQIRPFWLTNLLSVRKAAACPAPRARPVRTWWQILAAVLAGTALVGLWLTLPWLVALRLSAALATADAPALMRQLDAPAMLASYRAGLEAEVPDGVGEGARRFLSGMTERMATSWQTPTGMRAWLALRARGGPMEGSPVPLSTLRAARPIGLTAFRLEYGPARGEGGVAFDLAWQGGEFRVVGVRFLGPPARPWPATVLAMR